MLGMNPSSNETPGLNLPTPVNEQMPAPSSPDQLSQPQADEALPVAENSSSHEASASANVAAFAVPLPSQTPLANTGAVPATTNTVAHSTTNDSDLIDRAVVDKAKAIIAKTKDDPYQQTEVLTAFKADHLSKTYNVNLKMKPKDQ